MLITPLTGTKKSYNYADLIVNNQKQVPVNIRKQSIKKH